MLHCEVLASLPQAAPGNQAHVEEKEAQYARKRLDNERSDRLQSLLAGNHADDKSPDRVLRLMGHQHHARLAEGRPVAITSKVRGRSLPNDSSILRMA